MATVNTWCQITQPPRLLERSATPIRVGWCWGVIDILRDHAVLHIENRRRRQRHQSRVASETGYSSGLTNAAFVLGRRGRRGETSSASRRKLQQPSDKTDCYCDADEKTCLLTGASVHGADSTARAPRQWRIAWRRSRPAAPCPRQFPRTGEELLAGGAEVSG